MGRLLGIDYGEKRIGLALTDPQKIIARPFELIERKDLAQDLARLEKIVDAEEVEAYVVGRPFHAHGDSGQMVKKVDAFVAALVARRERPVHWVDERLTSFEAEETLRIEHKRWQDRKKKIDMLAAQIILRSFLEHGAG